MSNPATIHEAAKAGDVARVEQFLNANPSLVAAEEKWKGTPLHLAGNLEVATLLIDRGADVNARGWMATTPLHEAAGRGSIEIVEFLLRKGADINAIAERLFTPLFMAANAAVANLLIQHGADVQARDEGGEFALHWAARCGRCDVVEFLILQ